MLLAGTGSLQGRQLPVTSAVAAPYSPFAGSIGARVRSSSDSAQLPAAESNGAPEDDRHHTPVAPYSPFAKSCDLSRTSIISSPRATPSPFAKNASQPQRPVLPNTYYHHYFGFFCKQEWKWEKQTRLPVKLRLGSYQHAQRMEGK